MLQRFLSIVDLPEIRPDPFQTDKTIPEIELFIPVDVYWEICDLLKEMRFARVSNFSMDKHWRLFNRLIFPCIIKEKDRLWYRKNIG